MSERLRIVPSTLKAARIWVDTHHRHHRAPVGGLFAIGVAIGDEIRGVAIVGRPVARHNDNGYIAKVTRVAVIEDTPNACSMLYSACWRAARSMGYQKLITYTLASESGTSLRAAGWTVVGEVRGRSWNSAARPRIDKHPLENKFRWEAK